MHTALQIRFVRPDLPPLESYVGLLEEVWESGMLSNHARFAPELEARAAEYFAVERVLACANCDLGLMLAIAALAPEPGSEVVMPSFGFPSTAAAALWNGLRIRFVDVDPESWCVDPAAVAGAVGPRTSLIVATHMFGAAADVDALDAIAADRGIAILYDAAQATGTFVGDSHVAARGDAAVFSLGGTKVATSAEGGLAVFRDADAGARFERLRRHGTGSDGVARELGVNAKLSELHAALGCLAFERVEGAVAERGRLEARYRERLPGSVRCQRIAAGTRSGHTFFAVDAGAERDAIADRLAANGIETKKYFTPLHAMPRFADAAHGPLPVTEQLASRLLCLPLHPGLDDEDVDRVCALVAG